MKILLTPVQEQTLLSFGSMVQKGSNYYYFPFFFREEGGGIYDQLSWDELPAFIKDQILRIRGIKLPVNEKSSDGDADLR